MTDIGEELGVKRRAIEEYKKAYPSEKQASASVKSQPEDSTPYKIDLLHPAQYKRYQAKQQRKRGEK